jgi:hypothetical protein
LQGGNIGGHQMSEQFTFKLRLWALLRMSVMASILNRLQLKNSMGRAFIVK